MNEKNLKIALIQPPLPGHKFRGTGSYTQELYKALKKSDQVEITLANVDDRLDSFNIIHYPYFDPFFLTLPLIKRKPIIVTVHDLIPLKFPRFMPAGIRGRLKWQIQRFSLSQAASIITDSIASKDDIKKYTQNTDSKINVIYLGIGEEFKIIRSSEALDKVRKKYILPQEFILHVGDVNYNKNISNLIKAFNLVCKKFASLHLLLIGNGFVNPSNQLSELLSIINSLRLTDKIHRISHITTDDLVLIYNLASIYAQVSFAEGFGLPVLEAMTCGIPVIASNISSLPEVVGEAGILVDPYNIYSISDGMLTILQDKSKRDRIIQKGMERIKLFNWKKCAAETIKVYESVIS